MEPDPGPASGERPSEATIQGEARSRSPDADPLDEPVYVYDTHGKCRWVNRSGERLLGLDSRSIVGRYAFELFPGQSPFQIKAWRRVIDANESFSFVSEIGQESETPRFQTSFFPVTDRRGRVRSVVSIARPFVEREVLRHENRMRTAELALIDGIAGILTARLDIGEVYERFVVEFRKLVEFDSIAIAELDEANGMAVPTFISSIPDFAAVPDEPFPLSGTGLEWIIEHRRTYIEDDLQERQDFEFDTNLADTGMTSVMRVPLVTRSGLVGLLGLGSAHPHAFDKRAAAIAERVASQIAPAIENARLYREAQAHAKELEVIDEISRITTSSLRIEEVCERFASEVKRLVSFERISILLVDEGAGEATAQYATGPSLRGLRPGDRWSFQNNSGVAWVVENRRSLIESDLAEDRLFEADGVMLKAGIRSVIRVPLIYQERLIAAFALCSTQPRYYGAREQRILERLALKIAPAIENARLYAEVQRGLETLRTTQDQIVRLERLRAMGELAGGVAHDFNNSLAAILGRTQLLMTQTTSEDQAHSLRLIEQAARASAQVVKRILDFARFDSDTDFSGIDVSRLVENVVELTRHKWSDEARSKGRNIRVEVNVGDVPPALGNHTELCEVLMNLVINSCEAISGDGTIELTADGTTEQVHIAVSDTGTGMSPEVTRKVFEPFFSTKDAGGTGLGLSVAFGIVSRHNGTIEVESVEGVGTTVRVSLPTAPFVAPPPERLSRRRRASARAASILVIEDEPLIRETMSTCSLSTAIR